MPITTDFRHWMAKATALTRAGDLVAATSAVQSALAQTLRPFKGAKPRKAQPAQPVADVPPAVIVLPGPAGAATARRAKQAEPDAAHAAPAAKPAPSSASPTSTSLGPKHPLAGQFVDGGHACAAGRRAFKLYVPPQAGTRPLPLVVMLHGCTQDPADFAAGTGMNEAAAKEGVFVLYPEQSTQANPHRCWNWFKHTNQQRGRGEPALLAGMVQQVMDEHAVDAKRVYVAGLSAGGAMAAILGSTYPDVFAAVGVHSGLAAGAATDLSSAMQAMQGGSAATLPVDIAGPPTIVFHGSADHTVHPRNGEQVVASLGGAVQQVPADAAALSASGKRSSGGAGKSTRPGNPTRDVTRAVHTNAAGAVVAEHWLVHGAGHAWAGGSNNGSYTDPAGPDATAAMLQFFLAHPHR